MIIVLLVLSFYICKNQALMNIELISGFLTTEEIKIVSVIGCFDRRDEKSLITKRLSRENKILSIQDMRQLDIYLSLSIDHGQLGVVIDADCPTFEEFIDICGKTNLFDEKHTWLIMSSGKSIFQMLQSTEMYINAKIHVVLPSEEHSGEFIIFEVYNPGARRGGKLHANVIGNYDQEEGYRTDVRENKYWSRRNMTGVTVRGALLAKTHFNGTIEEYLEPIHFEWERFSRYQTRLIFTCQKYYNFTLSTIWKTSWGYMRNGTFDGIVGEMVNKSIDLSLTAFFLLEDRLPIASFGRKTYTLRGYFLFRNPKALTSFSAIFDPLSATVWVATCVVGAFAVCIMRRMTRFESKSLLNSDVESTWSGLILFTLGAICQQGAANTPCLLCGRIVVLFIFILSVVVYQFYSASIVSNLLMKASSNIKSIEDLVKYPIEVGCQDHVFLHYYFEYTKDYWSRELYKKMKKPGNHTNFFTVEKGVEMVGKGGFAFHVEEDNAYPIVSKTFSETAICELKHVNLIGPRELFTTYQKDSPFQDAIDTCLHCLAERGIMSRERNIWRSRKPECLQTSSVKEVTLGEFYPALLLVAGGIVASLIILMIELLIYYRKRIRLSNTIELRKVFMKISE